MSDLEFLPHVSASRKHPRVNGLRDELFVVLILSSLKYTAIRRIKSKYYVASIDYRFASSKIEPIGNIET